MNYSRCLCNMQNCDNPRNRAVSPGFKCVSSDSEWPQLLVLCWGTQGKSPSTAEPGTAGHSGPVSHSPSPLELEFTPNSRAAFINARLLFTICS